jgi:hypothetical protein
MPRWRRRRFQRLRKRERKWDDHTWVLKPVRDRRTSKIDLPAMHGNPAFTLKLKLDFTLVEQSKDGMKIENFEIAERFRICSVCGMELVGDQRPRLTCKETLVKKVMES